jgi:2-dehydro-3-deoxyphosphogluconate aldolase / (4S)-4-hydroxy-2-oxoglutarate aldolase
MIDLLKRVRIVPVLTIRRREDGVPLARALVAGGIDVLEITLRTPPARDAARDIIAQVPDAIVGLGTVLSPQDLADAEAMGAKFAVSPGSTPALLAAPRKIPLLPGIATASDAMAIIAAGHRAAKFFPAGAMGGIGTLKALAGPYPDLLFCPTGGVDAGNLANYLALPNVIAVGGSWVAPDADIAAGNWTAITERAREARAVAAKAKGDA